MNDALVTRAAEAKVLRLNEVRADTTVIEANVAYPVDSSLLAKGIARLTTVAARLKGRGFAPRTKLVNRTPGRDTDSLVRWVNDSAHQGRARRNEVRRLNTELLRLAEKTLGDVRAVARKSRRALTASANARAADRATLRSTGALYSTGGSGGRSDSSAGRRGAVTPVGATRLVSLHDPDARPIRKGRLGRPVKFGYKAQVVDNEDGVVLDWRVERGNPPDAPMLPLAIERIRERTGRVPRAVTADRGYGEASIDAALIDLGVDKVVIPRKGRPGAARHSIESARSFQRLGQMGERAPRVESAP